LWEFLISHMPATLHEHLIFLSFLSFFLTPASSYLLTIVVGGYCCLDHTLTQHNR
jgi:hypothetical protein